MSKLKVTTIADPDNDNTAISIDTSGNITIPNNATFSGTVAGAGKVLQVVQTDTNTNTTTTSTSYVDTALTASITPTSATSKILVMVAPLLYISRNGASMIFGDCYFNILRGATQLHAGRMSINFNNTTWADFMQKSSLIYLDSPSTTSSTTYKMQIRTGAGVQVQSNVGGSGNSTITLMEIAG